MATPSQGRWSTLAFGEILETAECFGVPPVQQDVEDRLRDQHSGTFDGILYCFGLDPAEGTK